MGPRKLPDAAASMRSQRISRRVPKADSALLRSSLFHDLCRIVSSSSGSHSHIGLDRLRRLKFMREQFFLAATAQNIKRLVRFLTRPTMPLRPVTA